MQEPCKEIGVYPYFVVDMANRRRYTCIIMSMYIAYYRVSTDKQGATGLGMDAQRAMLAPYSASVVAEYVEVESGRKSDRPQLTAALAHARAARATLLIAKLDRLARNVAFIAALIETGVDFIAADMPQANKLTLHIMAAFAEHEAEMISKRTKAALAIAKERGVKLGGYRGHIARAEEGRRSSMVRRRSRCTEHKQMIAPVISNIKANGAESLREIAAELTKRGYTAPRGGQWTATQVRRIAA